MAESYQIYLNSKYADTQNNDTYKFQLNTLEVQEGYYIYLSVQNVSIPYSFYNVNESNNKIEYIIFTQLYTVTIPPSNYNINQFIEYLSSVMTDFKITYSSKTNKITFVNNMINFTFLSSSTCYKILGFKEGINYTSSNVSLTSVNCVNMMTVNSIFVLSNLMTYNISSSLPNSQNVLCQVLVNNAPNSIIQCSNTNHFRTNLFINRLSNINLKLVDEYNNAINLYGLNFIVTLQLDIEPI